MSIPAPSTASTAILKSDPEYTNRDAVYYHLAQALVQLGQPADAIPYLDKLVAEFERASTSSAAGSSSPSSRRRWTPRSRSSAYRPDRMWLKRR